MATFSFFQFLLVLTLVNTFINLEFILKPTGSTAVVTDSETAATVVVEPTLNVRRGGRGRGRKGVTAKETAQVHVHEPGPK